MKGTYKMNCYKCHKEFTEDDKRHTNYKSVMGSTSHMMCPGTSCKICGKEIESYADAKRDALMNWQHKACKPAAINPVADEAREAALKDEIEEDRGYDTSTWIVK